MKKSMKQVERVVNWLLEHGWIEDGATQVEKVRMPTKSSPVFGAGGGEARTFGGRTRLRLPGTDRKVTIGPRTVCFYRRLSQGVVFEGNFATKDFEAICAFGAQRRSAMIAKLNRNTGAFSVHVEEYDCLRAPDGIGKDGRPEARKWLPCTQCGELLAVRLSTFAVFCDDDCKRAWDNGHPMQQREIPGYSHACGYHD